MKAIMSAISLAFILPLLHLTSASATGALAVGTCGASGYAWDAANEILAQSDALTRCPDSKCQVYLTVRRACAAMAYDPNTCAWGAASRDTLRDAQQTALATCVGHGGQSCVIRASFCDKTGDTD